MATTAYYRIRGAAEVPNTLALQRDGFDAWGNPQWHFTATVEDEVITSGTITGPPWVSDDDHAALVALTHIIEQPATDRTGQRWQHTHAAHLALALFDDQGHPIPTLAPYRVPGDDAPTAAS